MAMTEMTEAEVRDLMGRDTSLPEMMRAYLHRARDEVARLTGREASRAEAHHYHDELTRALRCRSAEHPSDILLRLVESVSRYLTSETEADQLDGRPLPWRSETQTADERGSLMLMAHTYKWLMLAAEALADADHLTPGSQMHSQVAAAARALGADQHEAEWLTQSGWHRYSIRGQYIVSRYPRWSHYEWALGNEGHIWR